MSASTAAIQTATTNANHVLSLDSHSSQDVWRRTAAFSKKKSTPELLAEGGVNGSSDDKTVSRNDLGHTIQGKSVVERLKNSSDARKDAVASVATAEHRKRSTAMPGKTRWETALSVVMKLCLLISSILWMRQLIWRWQNDDLSVTAIHMESGLSELEGLKKTAKMLQAQIDILDRKLGNEINEAKKDIIKQLEDKGTKLEAKMNTLEDKTDKLDKSLAELRDMGFVSKKEFDEFVTESKKKKGLDGDNDISLDDIRQFAKEIVEMEIARHAADGLRMVDYALGSGGGRVIKHSEPYRPVKSAMGLFASLSGVHPTAQKMLEPSFGQPGECFALEGSSGYVEIKLRTGIIPEAVTLEHVAESVAYDRSSAPKDCQVSAWYQGSEDVEKEHMRATIAEFSYDLERSNAQTYQIERTDSQVVNMVRLDFSSNHGNPEHTCIYRFRVHGTEPGSLSALQA